MLRIPCEECVYTLANVQYVSYVGNYNVQIIYIAHDYFHKIVKYSASTEQR